MGTWSAAIFGNDASWDTKDFKEEDGITYIPLYMAGLL